MGNGLGEVVGVKDDEDTLCFRGTIFSEVDGSEIFRPIEGGGDLVNGREGACLTI